MSAATESLKESAHRDMVAVSRMSHDLTRSAEEISDLAKGISEHLTAIVEKIKALESLKDDLA